MTNINDSFKRISEIMRNSFSGLDMSAGFKESIDRMNEQVGNMVKVFDSTLLLQNQSKFIRMSSQISEQMRDSMKWTQDIVDFSEVSNTLIQLSKKMNASYKDMYKALYKYDYIKLSKIIQDALKTYDYNNPFDVNAMTDQITEEYIADEETEVTEKSENIEEKDRKN